MLFFIIRRPSFFRGYSSIAGVAFVPKSSLTSSAIFTCISATGESLDVLVLSAAHGSRARPWLKAVDFSLLVGACVAFLGGTADSGVARCAQPMRHFTWFERCEVSHCTGQRDPCNG